VGHLKEAIVKKKPRAFPNVDADELKLWKWLFSIFIDSFLQLEAYNSIPSQSTI